MEIMLKGMILGIENMGAIFVKVTKTYIFFKIPENSEINDEEKLKRAALAFKKTLGLGLKIKKISHK